jgi:hypothetical protein
MLISIPSLTGQIDHLFHYIRRKYETGITDVRLEDDNHLSRLNKYCQQQETVHLDSNDQPHNANILQAYRINPVADPRNMDNKSISGIAAAI